jgi:hypothetical protein
MPAWILWLSPVIVAPLLAVAWITWAARPRGPEEARKGVEQYDRFRASLTEHAGAEHEDDGSHHGRLRGEHKLRRRAS